jgi:arsenical pump membrane protein
VRWVERKRLGGGCADQVEQSPMTAGSWTALAGIGVTAVALIFASALNLQLGLPTAILGGLTMLVVLVRSRASPISVLRGVSWSVLPLVAGLFVLVEGLAHTGVIAAVAGVLKRAALASPDRTAAGSGALIAIVSNLMNNLPAGLIASSTIAVAHPPKHIADAPQRAVLGRVDEVDSQIA